MDNKKFKLKLSPVIVVVVLVVGVAVYFSLAKPGAVVDTISAISGQKTAATTTGDNANGQKTTDQTTTAISESGSTGANPESTKTGSTQSDSTPQKLAANLTQETFNQLENGLTYAQVSAIIGQPVKLVSEYGTKGTPERTASYLYRGKDDQKIEAILVYKAGKLYDTLEITLGQSK